MEREISSSVTLGIVLIAVAAVTSLGISVFNIARGTANTGVNSVQEGVKNANESGFQDFNQTQVSGTQVLAALNNYANKAYAIIVQTKLYSKNHSGESMMYNAILDMSDASGLWVKPGETYSGGTNTSGSYLTSFTFKTEGSEGDVVYNLDTANTKKSGHEEYIAETAYFRANLIKNESGVILGIVFRQM